MSVEQSTDRDDVEDTDLATFMAENHKKAQPGSPLYGLYARDFDYTTVESRGNVLNALYAERQAQAPGWMDDGETYESPTPARSLWRSVPIRLNLREERGQRDDDVFMFAHLKAVLMQEVSESEPCVNLTRRTFLENDQKWKEWHSARLTISEATELAHMLLLLVDVATGTSDEIAGEAR
ncbi:hypothetical protein CH260_10395 [Rhodococcus sp. 05-2256-B2]|uniref:hypothetical protein n=1 Tax=unclassified Rhodococcus (in: high G+C Gram-positive bacteria) TaxID=192944 RepID=UPI000B9BA746|nr:MULTISPECIES: hypothetical protein [unclassified Rhodococcus (in: high G+C Gram-positive bacteria)]OZD81814.1 hypothetical protein CH258_19785 [Rhodococcus sp. 05-2256-B4]OZD90435.1 hypothetical protein CH257_18180 [Rhodococcus sp. 05-2256-B3]OZD96941.1 hypothetical protein CH260_10395 [Rhodococcus sp. 05-2256-B2]OZE00437.1 hypothetical protein CH285_19430 [Rhodococcus sp. 05-2256-B1]